MSADSLSGLQLFYAILYLLRGDAMSERSPSDEGGTGGSNLNGAGQPGCGHLLVDASSGGIADGSSLRARHAERGRAACRRHRVMSYHHKP